MMNGETMQVVPPTESRSATQRRQSCSGSHALHSTANSADTSSNSNKENDPFPTPSAVKKVTAAVHGRALLNQNASPLKQQQQPDGSQSTLGLLASLGKKRTRNSTSQQDGGVRSPQGWRRKTRASTSSGSSDSQNLRGMWDNVVAMMKSAIDTILFDDEAVEVAVDACSEEPQAKRRHVSESGMQLHSSQRTAPSHSSYHGKPSAAAQKPGKIKEAKKLNPNTRKRRVVRRRSFSSQSNHAIKPMVLVQGANTCTSPTSKQHPQELDVFKFRSSPLAKQVANTVGTSPYSRARRQTHLDSGSPRFQHCPVPYKPGNCSRSSSAARLFAASSCSLQLPSPLCSPSFTRIDDSSLGDCGKGVVENDTLERHAECVSLAFGRSEASSSHPSSRPSSRNGLSRAKAFFQRGTPASAGGSSNESSQPSNLITPVDSEDRDSVCVDPLLQKKVTCSVMPVRTGKSLASSAKALRVTEDGQPADGAAVHGSEEGGDGTALELPRPPTPPPLPPMAPPPPPSGPPPTLGRAPALSKRGGDVDAGTSTAGRMLAGMQKRLRSRMRQQASTAATSKCGEDGDAGKPEGDPKASQWAAIQAKFRKISIEEFLQLAAKHRMVAVLQIRALSRETPTQMVDIIDTVESLMAATCWWPGGGKEMKETIEEWKAVEPKLEIMSEYVKVTHSMEEVAASLDQPQKEFHLEVARLRDAFMRWHRSWSGVLLSNASSWRGLNLPVNDSLLNQARCFLAEIMLLMAHRVASETALLNGRSIAKSHRQAKQLAGLLQECIELLTTALDIVKADTRADASGSDSEHQAAAAAAEGLSAHVKAIKSAAVLCTQRYGELLNAEYVAVFHCHSRTEVTAHFDGILKVLGLLKTLARHSMDASLPWTALTQGGVLNHFSDTTDLSSAIHKSCVHILQHIMKSSEHALSRDSDSSETSAREMMLWLMYGCKFVNRCLEMLGDNCEVSVKGLLDSLQQIEATLPSM